MLSFDRPFKHLILLHYCFFVVNLLVTPSSVVLALTDCMRSLLWRKNPSRSLTVKFFPPARRITHRRSMQSAAASPQENNDPFSLARLHERLADFLQQKSNNYPQQQLPRLSIAVAGGGSHLISSLAATPGASAVLLQGLTTYDRESYRQFVDNDDDLPLSEGFKYTSAESAYYLAQAAVRNALTLTAVSNPSYRIQQQQQQQPSSDATASSCNVLQHMTLAVGLACTSALRTTAATGTKSNSRAYITAALSDGRCIQLAATMAAERERWQEDIWVSHALLSCLEYALLVSHDDNNGNKRSVRQWQRDWTQRLQRRLDEDSATARMQLASEVEVMSMGQDLNYSGHSSFYSDRIEDDQDDDDSAFRGIQWTERSAMSDSMHVRIPCRSSPDVVVREAAKSILTGREQSVLLVPRRNEDNDDSISTKSSHCQRFAATVLPPNSLIFPGSFNPPHKGHIELVKSALRHMKDTSTHDSKHKNAASPVAWFELSLTNADKPPLQVEAVVERLEHFLSLEGMESLQWGIALTNAPLFAQKVNLLQPKLLSRTHKNTISNPLPLSFGIGTDTLVRLLNPKYYNNSRDEMLQALRDMPCRFLVGGRLDQTQSSPTTFVTGKEDIDALPPQLACKFTILSDFRVDISSTEIRQQQEEKEPSL